MQNIPESMMEVMTFLCSSSLVALPGYAPAISLPGMTQFELGVGPFISAFSSIVEASITTLSVAVAFVMEVD